MVILPYQGKNPHGRAGNRTPDLMIRSQERWPIDHEAGRIYKVVSKIFRTDALPTSTRLCATWHTGSLDMVVLPSTGASHYHTWCHQSGIFWMLRWHAHNQFPPPQQFREWSDVNYDGRALEFVQQCPELCSLWVSLCVRHCHLKCYRSWTGHAIETPAYDSRFGPRRLVELLWRSALNFSQDWQKICCTIIVPFFDPSWRST
jgi:hypothetical protein